MPLCHLAPPARTRAAAEEFAGALRAAGFDVEVVERKGGKRAAEYWVDIEATEKDYGAFRDAVLFIRRTRLRIRTAPARTKKKAA